MNDLIQTLNVFICVTQNIFPLIFRKISCGMLESESFIRCFHVHFYPTMWFKFRMNNFRIVI